MIFPLRCPLSIAGEQLKTENKISAFKCLPRPAFKTQFVPVPGICSLPYRPSFNELLHIAALPRGSREGVRQNVIVSTVVTNRVG